MTTLPPHEPTDLRALLEDAPYIDDAGFSGRVMRALPRRGRGRSVSYALVPAFATLGCVLAFVLSGSSPASRAPHSTLSVAFAFTSPLIALVLAVLLVGSAALLTAEE